MLLADVAIVIGSNPTVNHPVAATFMKNAAKAGTKLIVMDPRRNDMARHAAYYLQFRADTDVALLNAIMHTIIEEGLADEAFIRERTENYAALEALVADYRPEKVAPVTGIDAKTIREVARLYATSKRSMIFWGMGISQHVHGTDNARCLISLALLTGQIGRPGTGLHPLRGQNNVQGASDVGLIPMSFPDYARVDNPAAHERFEALWGMPLDSKPGLTVTEVMDAAHAGTLRGMYIMGENPAMSDPNVAHARDAMVLLEHLVVQDIFFTETAGFADVILPASAFPEKTGTFTNTDRRVQMGRKAVDPPGQARQDLWIITELARRIGLDWNYRGPQDVFAEIRRATPSMAGITWERLEAEGSCTYPLEHEGDPGSAGDFRRFVSARGRPRAVRAGGVQRRGRTARRRVPLHLHDRTAARALAYGIDDAARQRPRRARTRAHHRHPSRRSRGGRRRTRRHADARVAARHADGECARRPRHAARHALHGLRIQ